MGWNYPIHLNRAYSKNTVNQTIWYCIIRQLIHISKSIRSLKKIGFSHENGLILLLSYQMTTSVRSCLSYDRRPSVPSRFICQYVENMSITYTGDNHVTCGQLSKPDVATLSYRRSHYWWEKEK